MRAKGGEPIKPHGISSQERLEMADRNDRSEDTGKKDEPAEIELFDPWEQRFKFEPRSRLHGHVIERESDGDSGTIH